MRIIGDFRGSLMPASMTPRERVQAALKGKSFDRPPISMWRHFYDRETTAQGMAEAMLAFQAKFNWDFMKVNPRADYHVEDWGVRLKYSGNPNEAPTMVEFPVKKPEDWERVQPLDIHKGALGEHLKALQLIAKGLKGRVPFLMTVFTPLSIASRLVSSEETLVQHMGEHPEKLHQALAIITETFTRYARACLEAGASGIFYATTSWATYDRLTQREYRAYGHRYDVKLLNALPAAPFNILHVCRDNNMLVPLRDYPVAAFNWDARGKGNLSLNEGKALLGNRTVIGGVSHHTILRDGTPEQVKEEVRSLKSMMGDSGWMLGPGCTFSPQVPEANLAALRQAVG